MTWLHRLTIFGYALMAASCAWSAYLPTGTWAHVACAALWIGLTVLAWRNGRMDQRIREAARLSAVADGIASVASSVAGLSERIGPVANDIAAAAYGAAADMRRDAIAVLDGRATHPAQHPLHCEQPIPGQRETP